ncbi:unnamed protein product [Sphagnum tenellum]
MHILFKRMHLLVLCQEFTSDPCNTEDMELRDVRNQETILNCQDCLLVIHECKTGQGRNRLQESASNNISSNGELVLQTYHELDRRDNIDPSMHNVTVERDFGT